MIGRFISPDTIVPEFSNPQSLNRYSYVINNPLKHTDSTGHFWDTIWDIIQIMADVYACVEDPSVINFGMLGADVALALVPFVPAGAGITGRVAKTTLKYSDEAADILRGGNKVDNMLDMTGLALKASDDVIENTAKYSQKTFRKNLQKLTGLSDEAIQGQQAHHVLPQQFDEQFMNRGMDIHDPKYGVWVDQSLHLTQHKQYNQMWAEYLYENPRASVGEIESFAVQMMDNFYGLQVNFK